MLTAIEDIERRIKNSIFDLEKRLFVQTQTISDEIVRKIILTDEIIFSFCELRQKYAEKRDGLERFLFGSKLRGERETEIEKMIERNLESWYRWEIKRIGIEDTNIFLCRKIKDKHLRFIIAEKMHLVLCCNWLDERGGFEKNLKMEKEMKRLGFGDFYERSCYSDGDSYYGPKNNIFEKVRKELIKKFHTTIENPNLMKSYFRLPVRISRLEKGSKELEVRQKETRERTCGQKLIEKYGYNYKEIKRQTPWLPRELDKLYLVSDLKIKEDVIAIVSTGQYTKRGPGVEYGTVLTIFRVNQEKPITKYFKYRDAFSEAKDNRSNCFEKCEIKKITPNSVTIVLDKREEIEIDI
ncbi:MAG: hypothetical protein WA064_00080 [Candidatus Moraniibacteriota bacterium]